MTADARGPAPSAQQLWMQARAASDMGRWATGLRLAKRALRQWEREPGPDELLRARIYVALAYNYSELGHLGIAQAMVSQAAEIGPGVLPPVRVARAMLSVRTGHPDDALEDFDLAVADLRTAVVAAGREAAVDADIDPAPTGGAVAGADRARSMVAPGVADLCGALINRGLMHMTGGRLAAAVRDTEEAGELAARLRRPDMMHMAAHNLGYARFLSGDLPGALASMDVAVRAWPESIEHGVSMLDRARVLAAAGLVVEASGYLDRALAYFRTHRATADLVDTYSVRSELDLMTGDPDAALRHGRLAERTAGRRGNVPAALTARLLQLRALRERRRSRPGPAGAHVDGTGTSAVAARRDAQRAARLAAAADAAAMPELARAATLLQAEAQLDAGDREGAAGLVDAARERAGRPPLASRLHARLVQARLALADGRQGVGRTEIRLGLDDLARFRASFGSQDLQVAASVHGSELAVLGLRTAAASGSPAAIFQWLERARGVSTRLPAVRPVPDPQLAEALGELRVCEDRLRQLLVAGQRDPGLEARAEEIRQRVRARAWTAIGAGDVLKPPSLASVQRSLAAAGDGRVVVAYIRGSVRVHALVVTAGTAGFHDLCSFSELQQQVKRLVADLDVLAGARVAPAVRTVAQRSLTAGLAGVSTELVAPLLPAMSDGPVLVTGLGVLTMVPWTLLPDLRGRMVTVNSSVTAAVSSAPPVPGGPQVLSVSGPDLASGSAEAAAVAALYPGAKLLLGAAATGQAVLDAIPHDGVVHIAAHGHHAPESPLFSSVLLADGPLYGYDIAPNPALPAQVVLSSCEVGRDDVRAGEPLGLAAALLRSGVRTVVAGVSRVADPVAAAVMTSYHRNLIAGRLPARALCTAIGEAADGGEVAPFNLFGAGL